MRTDGSGNNRQEEKGERGETAVAGRKEVAVSDDDTASHQMYADVDGVMTVRWRRWRDENTGGPA